MNNQEHDRLNKTIQILIDWRKSGLIFIESAKKVESIIFELMGIIQNKYRDDANGKK